MSQLLARFWKNKSGATAIEYGLIAAGISVAIIAAVNGIGTKLEYQLRQHLHPAEVSFRRPGGLYELLRGRRVRRPLSRLDTARLQFDRSRGFWPNSQYAGSPLTLFQRPCRSAARCHFWLFRRCHYRAAASIAA